VRKCVELHDMSNKKYSESVAKEKSLGTKEAKSWTNLVSYIFIAHFEVTNIPL